MAPRTPWPLLIPPTQPVLDRVASWGLQERPIGPLVTADHGGWTAVVAAAQGAKLLGILRRTVDDGSWVGDDMEPARLEDLLRGRLTMDLVAERRAVLLSALFTRKGVRHVVFKGAATAHQLEIEPGCRHFDDVDLLVPAEDLRGAKEVLEGLAAARLYPEPRPGFDERFGKGATFSVPDFGAVDLHRMVATGWVGARLLEVGLFDDPGEVDLAGWKLPTMGPLQTALVTGIRAVAGAAPMTSRELRDACLAWRAPGVDHGELVEQAESLGLGALLAVAVRNAIGRLGLVGDDQLERWALGYSPSRRELARLHAYTPHGWSYPRQLASQLRDLPGVGNRVRMLFALSVPAGGTGRAPLATRARTGFRSLTGADR